VIVVGIVRLKIAFAQSRVVAMLLLISRWHHRIVLP
jgi:hypothetical protein